MIDRKIVYSAPIGKFFDDVRSEQFAYLMQDKFLFYAGRKVGPSEFNSWVVTGSKIKNLIELAQLNLDIYLAFEYQIPYNQNRIDCLIFGKGEDLKDCVVHIELKQWDKVEPSEIEGEFKVDTYTGGAIRSVPHPSQQVEGYNDYLSYFVEIFENDKTSLFGCAYCPNYRKILNNGLFDERYESILNKYPVYSHDDISELSLKLKTLLSKGSGLDIFNKFMQSPVRPSRKLLDNLVNVVLENNGFALLNEQISAKNTIRTRIKMAEKSGKKCVIIVKGAPGTGKTVVAINVLADIASRQKRKTIFFSSKSKPLIEAIKNRVGKKGKQLFTNLSPFVPNKVKENEVDLLIIDEAHRIQKTSNSQFSRKEDRTDMPQVEQLIRCAKTSVFFIDDNQVIRSLEVGNIDLIKDFAIKYNCNVDEIELTSQFRCNGSNNYLDWVESVLGYSGENKILDPRKDNFDFKIFDNPSDLYENILQKNNPPEMDSRLVAGYCWPWSKKLDKDGNLVKDVVIEKFALPWETHGQINPPNGYVKWYEWAYKKEGIKQVGCIYTAQGFEFDYIGVIIGPDLKYDALTDSLVGDVSKTYDSVLRRKKENFTKYVRNIYRVLLTRGMKGCYVYFVDKQTEEYFKKFINF